MKKTKWTKQQQNVIRSSTEKAGVRIIDATAGSGKTTLLTGIAVENLDGRSIRIGGPNEAEQRTLLFFLSPTCPVCATLLPTLRRMVDPVGAKTRLIYASDGPRAEHESFCKEKGIATADYVLSRDLGMRFEVSKLPYAVLIDASGTIRAKGLVNTREHVESLFEAERLGVASLQEYLESESHAKDPITLEQGAA